MQNTQLPRAGALPERARVLLAQLGVDLRAATGNGLRARTPVTGETLATLRRASPADVAQAIEAARLASVQWRTIPAPRRGDVVRAFGQRVREHKATLGELVSIETGKILSEGLGEVQELIDMCDFAVGLSRQLYGLTIASERPGHRMMETWHPLGVCGVITAFNFPVAVWGWNAVLALVCGNTLVWKPSEKACLSALACQSLLDQTLSGFAELPRPLSTLVLGEADAGMALVGHDRVPLISATGSTRMGQAVATQVAGRFGRAILELGGNNAAIVAPSADLDLAVRAIVFAAAGTAGQRCTSLRRLIVHESQQDRLVERLKRAYTSLRIGNPLDAGTLVGPLIDPQAFASMRAALEQARAQGGVVFGGARKEFAHAPDAYYAAPAICTMAAQTDIVRHETFAPILYVMAYRDIVEAIEIQNGVPQGLASGIFTKDLTEAELFLSAAGSDCGIANVNIGPSGAEIGGAFGGEKQTGGGREAGSDAWKAYMRRATNTINYSNAVPFAQGVKFDID